MKIIVTGGSGFVGEHLVRRLAADGHTVLALARSVASADKVRTLGATPLPGDLDSPDELDLPAVDAVVHAAAYFRSLVRVRRTSAPTSQAPGCYSTRRSAPAPPHSCT